ncbi:CapA family protein [Virgibacillus sp. MSP4-1]|uniref:CapA family protein n=1 Tax=Virgibacillus sp. MSP4-1 TaxID=2700081 RepID=UPI00039ADB81|nr:CapA family protein [Virgibacillus sp. MSP4-1]QHS22064.1 CapA family protein [Virgibacillus sp. MSP4-1]
MKKAGFIGAGILLVLLFMGMFLFGQEDSRKTYAYHHSLEHDVLQKLMPESPLPLIPQEPVSISFAGDTMFDGSVRSAVHQQGPDYPFQYVKKEVRKSDYAILNLETAVTTEQEKDTVQLYNFKADPKALSGIKQAGFDMVTLANNHALDYQEDGFKDTIKHLTKHDLKYFGAGVNQDRAYGAQTIEIKGRTIKFLGFSRFLPAVRWYEGEGPVIASAYQQDRVLKTIKRESGNADYLFVYIHWGVEGNVRPETWQRDYARKMIDAGADGIIGAHPHVLQGFEYYQNKPIAYSLGNFLFPDYVQGNTAETGVLTLKIDGDNLTMAFTPYRIRSNQIHPLKRQEKEQILQKLEELSFEIRREGTHIYSS